LEDLGKQSIVNGAEEKLDAEQEVAFEVLSTYVLTFNDEAKTSWKMRRQLNSQEQKPPLELARRDREQTTNLFECLLQDLPEQM
jgi:hypothetical protein